MRQPHVSEQSVVSLLVEDQLAVATKTGVDFAVTIEVGGKVPRAVVVVEVKDHAFADVDIEADILAASVERVSICQETLFEEGEGSLLKMLVTTPQLILHTAYSLRAKDLPAKQANAGIHQFLLCIRAPSPIRFLNQAVVVLGQTNKLEDRRVRKTRQFQVSQTTTHAEETTVTDPARDHLIERVIGFLWRLYRGENVVERRDVQSLG